MSLLNASKPLDAALSSPARLFLCDAGQFFKIFHNVLSDGWPVFVYILACYKHWYIIFGYHSDGIRNAGFSTTGKFSREGATCNILHNPTMLWEIQKVVYLNIIWFFPTIMARFNWHPCLIFCYMFSCLFYIIKYNTLKLLYQIILIIKVVTISVFFTNNGKELYLCISSWCS